MKMSLILTVAVAFSSLGCQLKNWQGFSEHGFTVTMPGTPKRGQQVSSAGDITAPTYIVEFRDEVYTVSYNDYTPSDVEKMSDTEKLLEGARNGAVASLNGTLIEEHKITLGGYAGREFTAESAEKDATVTYRIYWAPPCLYIVIYTRRHGAPLSKDGQKFLDSFHLKSDGGSDTGQKL